MSYKLFLDDIRQAPDSSWIIARTYEEAVDIVIERGFPNMISFDHDLGYNQPTGKDFANFLIDVDLIDDSMPDDFHYIIHSANLVGAENIKSILDRYLQFKGIVETL
jgi:hypothetical protein